MCQKTASEKLKIPRLIFLDPIHQSHPFSQGCQTRRDDGAGGEAQNPVAQTHGGLDSIIINRLQNVGKGSGQCSAPGLTMALGRPCSSVKV